MQIIVIEISLVIALIVVVRSGILVLVLIVVVVVVIEIRIIIEVGVGVEVVLIVGERGEMLIMERRVESGTTDLREVSWEASHVDIRREEHGWLNKHVLVPRGHHWVVEGEKSSIIIFAVVIEFITFILGLHDGSSLKETDVAAAVLEEVFGP
jgi:hypothetical protein